MKRMVEEDVGNRQKHSIRIDKAGIYKELSPPVTHKRTSKSSQRKRAFQFLESRDCFNNCIRNGTQFTGPSYTEQLEHQSGTGH